jgi:hypothetical protein
MRGRLPAAVICAIATSTVILAGQSPSVASRAKAARTVVLAEVEDVQPRFDQNRHGDRLIVSDVYVRVEEAWKGAQPSSVLIATVEGGTVGELSLRVSDMPALKRGDRAVFFLDQTAPGRYAPHGRGHGVLKLTSDNRAEGTGLTLAQVRQAARAAAK